MGTANETFTLKIRASAAGKLMTGNTGLTANQLATLNSYQARKNGNGRPLTPIQETDLKELIAKRDAPPELSQGAKTYIEELFLKLTYGYDEPVVTDVLMKGNLCEQDGMALLDEVCPLADEFRRKNRQQFEDEYFMGMPDVLLRKAGEDIKNCWSIKTFFNTTELDPIYYAQGQVYMKLTGRQKFHVHYCLVDTPPELVANITKKYFWAYGGNEENPHYLEAVAQIERNHMVSYIPARERVKTFSFDYDPVFISELQSRVILARAYFKTLTLNRKK